MIMAIFPANESHVVIPILIAILVFPILVIASICFVRFLSSAINCHRRPHHDDEEDDNCTHNLELQKNIICDVLQLCQNHHHVSPGLETSKRERRGLRTGQNKTKYQKVQKNINDDDNDDDDDVDDNETIHGCRMHPRRIKIPFRSDCSIFGSSCVNNACM